MKKTKVAFICTHNACRSQIAEGFGRALFSDTLECYSAGTNIAEQINPDAVRIMRDHYGIDLTAQYPKKLSDLPPIDIVVTMGCGVQCPSLPCRERYDWGLEDPTGKEDSEFLKVMEEIKMKLKDLES
jgi:protein-tyrosine-phosphatase